MWLVWRLLINAAALWAATRVVPGISFDGDWRLLFAVALVFGVLNVAVRPILAILTFPLLIVTLGLVSDAFGLGFHVDGFVPAFLGALVVSIVSFALSLFVRSGRQNRERSRRSA